MSKKRNSPSGPIGFFALNSTITADIRCIAKKDTKPPFHAFSFKVSKADKAAVNTHPSHF